MAAVVLRRSVKGDMITIFDGEQPIPALWTHAVPASLGGAITLPLLKL